MGVSFRPFTEQGDASMAIDGRIRELGNRHQTLDRAIQDELSRPMADATRLATLKRQKLRLKEQLTQLQAGQH
jgi:hypothetical protein